MTPYVLATDEKIKALKQLQHGHRMALHFDEAAKEVLRVSLIAFRPYDLKWCELMRRELIEDYNVDWSKIVKEIVP